MITFKLLLLIYFTSLACYLCPKVHCKRKIGTSWPVDDSILQVTYGGELMFISGSLAAHGGEGGGPAIPCWQGHRWRDQHSGNVAR